MNVGCAWRTQLRRLLAAPTFEVCSKLTWINGFAALPLRFLPTKLCMPSRPIGHRNRAIQRLICIAHFCVLAQYTLHTLKDDQNIYAVQHNLSTCHGMNLILFDLYLSIRSEIDWNSLCRFTSFNLILILSHSGGTNRNDNKQRSGKRQHSDGAYEPNQGVPWIWIYYFRFASNPFPSAEVIP